MSSPSSAAGSAGRDSCGRTAATLDLPTAARVFVWGGFQVVAQQVLTGQPEQDANVAREFAEREWYGAFRRPA